MFHHFAELGGPTLVRSTDFDYRTDPDTLLSLLTAVTVTGHRKDAAGIYKSASMPSVTFKYSEFLPHKQRYQSVAAQGNDIVPLVGARRRERLTEALGALDVKLTSAHLATLAKAFPPGVASGNRYPDAQLAHMDSEK